MHAATGGLLAGRHWGGGIPRVGVGGLEGIMAPTWVGAEGEGCCCRCRQRCFQGRPGPAGARPETQSRAAPRLSPAPAPGTHSICRPCAAVLRPGGPCGGSHPRTAWAAGQSAAQRRWVPPRTRRCSTAGSRGACGTPGRGLPHCTVGVALPRPARPCRRRTWRWRRPACM